MNKNNEIEFQFYVGFHTSGSNCVKIIKNLEMVCKGAITWTSLIPNKVQVNQRDWSKIERTRGIISFICWFSSEEDYRLAKMSFAEFSNMGGLIRPGIYENVFKNIRSID